MKQKKVFPALQFPSKPLPEQPQPTAQCAVWHISAVAGPILKFVFLPDRARRDATFCKRKLSDGYRQKKVIREIVTLGPKISKSLARFRASRGSESTCLESNRNPRPSARYAVSQPSLGRSRICFLLHTQLVHTHLWGKKFRKSNEANKSSGQITPQSTLKRPVPQMQYLYMRERLRSGQNLDSAVSACQWSTRFGGLPHGSLPSFMAWFGSTLG